MRTRWLRPSKVLLAAGIVAITVPAVAAQKGKPAPAPKPTPIPMVITVADTFASGATCSALTPPLIRSDGAGDYVHGDKGVSAYSEDEYGWGVIFATDPPARKRPESRKVALGLCDTPVDAIVDEHVYAFLFKKAETDTTLRSMTTGSGSITRRFYMQWPRTNARYRLSWLADANSSGVSVTCSADSGISAPAPPCVQWKVTPDGPAELLEFAANGTLVTTGNSYDMPFEMTIDVQ